MRPLSILGFALVLSSGCYPEKADSPLRGELNVLIPESVAPALIQQVETFVGIYGAKGARVSSAVVTSEEAIRRFLQDTLRAVFTTRPLTTEEKQRAEEQTGPIAEIRVFYDGIVVVVHHKNPVDRITTQELLGLLEGRITRWEELPLNKSMKGRIRLLLQQPSDVSAYLQRRLPGLVIKASSGGSESSLQILRGVVSDVQSIGLVGLDWIDSAKVPAKVIEIAAPRADADTVFKPPVETIGKFYPPHPAHLYRNYYPMKRAVYFYSRSLRGDLSSGFAAFVANKEGQRLFLERGLVPATQPIRLRPSE